ncbi:MAG: ribonucleoside reductase class II [Candidatus Wildermuthbacteria bacterium]|nr:ribonucleoside reductase class II [Candidatus Wildermuthbacteria bacterium]
MISRRSWKIRKKREIKDFGWIFPFHPVRDLGYSWGDIKRLHDGARNTMSYSVLLQIQQRAFLRQAELATQEKVDWTGFLPVRLQSIEKAGKQEVYDFEVEEVHMINAGLYTKNSRHGANMSMMRVDHPDVLDFIECKKKEGDIRNFNISVTVTDEFMQALEKTPNKQWYCTFKGVKTKPHKVLRHPNGSVYETEDVDITVKELFDKLVEAAWLNGEPGIAFVDTWNKTNPLPGLGPLASTNPCITGDSMVVTEHGIVRMEELAVQYGDGGVKIATDRRVFRTFAVPLQKKVFAGNADQSSESGSTLLFSAPNMEGIGEMTKAWLTGIKPVYRITTKSGYQLEATADHKLFTPEGKKPLADLQAGDRILIQSQEGLWNKDERIPFDVSNIFQGNNGRTYRYAFPNRWSKELGQMLGWLVGDGWVRDVKKHYAVGLTFSQEDSAVMEYLKAHINRFYGRDRKEIKRDNGVFHLIYGARPFVEYVKQLGVKAVRAQEKEVPHTLWSAPKEAVVGFLQGLFSADGTVNVHEKNQTRYIRLTSKSEKLLRQVQILLLNFGVKTSLYNRSRKPRMALGYANDGILFELQIAKTSIPVFLENIGFLGTHYREKTDALKQKEFYREKFEEEIQEIALVGDKKVYDLTEALTHSFIANGFVISNCGEQVLHPYDNCNLSSINLAVFVKDKKVDFKRLQFAVRTATRLTDNVIDRFDYPVAQVTDMAKKNRRIGLGIMGFADMLYQLGVRYDSKKGFAVAEKVMGFINEEARKMSMELAKEKGAFPNLELSVYAKKKLNMRNAALTTVAPTGSISMMMDASSGIEPNFALVYVKQDKDGNQYRYFNSYFEEALNALKLSKKEKDEIMQEVVKTGSIQHIAKLPKEFRDTFVISMDISGEDHMNMQAAFQRHVDNSISKTVNFPNSATKEDVANVFVSAWKLGCKSCTVYRDGSRTIQVLNVGTGENIVAPTEIPSAVQKKETDLPIDKQRLAPRPRPQVMSGKTYKMKTGYGNLYVTVNNDERGIPFEMFATIGKSGGFYQEQSEAITRMVSLALRSGIKVEEVVDNLKGIRGPMPVFTETGTILSLPDALGKVLEEHVGSVARVEEIISRPENQEVLPFVKEEKAIADFGFMPGCPDCGSPLQMQEGCIACKSCGFSRCS